MSIDIDLSLCDLEPISLIGKVQSFGAMLVASSFVVTHASQNISEFTKLSANNIIGLKIEDIFPGITSFFNQSSGNLFLTNGLGISLKKEGSHNIYEIEKVDQAISIKSEVFSGYLDRLQSSQDLKVLLENTVSIISEITDLDRVMIYRFHDDLHGEVVAEKVKSGVESFMGLHYPASDIPAPAREIFYQTWVRVIADVHAETFPVLSKDNSPINLYQSLLRAASPIHIEYLKNMNVGSSLTISIKVNNKLWGLVACHNIKAKSLNVTQRELSSIIGRMCSTHIEGSLRAEEQSKKEKIRSIHNQLIANVKTSQDIALELTRSKPNLTDLIESQGAAAALYADGAWATVGKVPTLKQLDELADWLRQEHKDKVIFSTHELSVFFPAADAYKDVGSGLLAVGIPKTEKNFIFWFRPEVEQTVFWAGNPHGKKMESNGRLNPRESFERWKESISGKSLKWHPWEIDAVLDLRNEIMGIDLRRQFEKEQLSRSETEAAIAAREELVEVVSHDLKNPLSSIFITLQLLERLDTLTDRQRMLVDRVKRASTVMNNLILDILNVTKLESGLLKLDYEKRSMDNLIRESMEILEHVATKKKIQIEFHNPYQSSEFYFDYGRILQVFSNLMGNALKFTPETGKVFVTIEKFGPEFVNITIRDTGVGIAHESLKNVFDRFWQANNTRRLGTGLGLSIVKGIIDAHGGKISVTSEMSIGSTFHISLPLKESL